MNISIRPDLEEFVESQIACGAFRDTSAVVNAALAFLKSETNGNDVGDWTIEDLRKEIAIGLEQLQRGEGQPWNVQKLKDRLEREQQRGK